MIILSYPGRHKKNVEHKRLICICGLGLVGSAILDALKVQARFDMQQKKLDWSAPVTLGAQIGDAWKFVDWKNVHQIDFVWSAGKAGFSSTAAETGEELISFTQFLSNIKAVSSALIPQAQLYVHLISSAGGLFEGQRVIDKNQKPLARRPYGVLKLEQERLLASYFPNEYNIYRPSSIYGIYKKGKRSGLIASLIRNTLTNKVTFINGRDDTLRDYIWVGDVADFIVKKIWFRKGIDKYGIHFLVSGKPTSIYEICRLVQHITNGKVLQRYDMTYANRDQIVFSPSVRPSGWKPEQLPTGVRRVFQSALY